jgi:hypothetical protein
MTQDEIIEMARKAGGIDLSTIHGGGVRVWLGTDRTEFFETLIKLAVAKEREACAKVVDDWSDWHGGTELIAAVIRERGQA